VEYRRCQITSLLGHATYERAYYHCRHCHQGWFPSDSELGIVERKSSGAREVVTLVGTLDAFEEAAHKVLNRLTGLSMSASTVQRTTEAVGEDVARRRAAGEVFGPPQVWAWNLDHAGRKVACIALDATGVHQQGPRGEKRPDRMPYVAAVFNARPREAGRSGPLQEVRYIAGLMSLPEIGSELRRECQQVGIENADVIVALSDGGNGLEGCLLDAMAGLGPRIEFVLDFYHAVEHLRAFAQCLIPEDEQRRKEQVETWSHRLKHAGGQALVKDLRTLDLTAASPSVHKAREDLLGYLERNLHRTEYPTYLARGWQIGSGTIESACKTVVGQRLKQGGMRWRERGTTALCQLRALFKSTAPVWEAYWSRELAT
jgi:hypothetical protein